MRAITPRNDGTAPAPARIGKNHLWFGFLCVAAVVLLHELFAAWIRRGVDDEHYTVTLFAPVVSAALIWVNREAIFLKMTRDLRAGVLLGAAGGILLTLAYSMWPGHRDIQTLAMAGIVLLTAGGFAGCYGAQAIRAAWFPLCFLIFMIPLPEGLMHRAVAALQWCSAESVNVFLRWTGMPVLREETFRFALPGVVIEIAEECSGIRSASSLVVSSVIGAHFLFRSFWPSACFVLLSIPVSILKNALRITAISWLGVNVDHGFFYGDLHKYGGMAFSIVPLVLMGGAAILLRRLTGLRDGVGLIGPRI